MSAGVEVDSRVRVVVVGTTLAEEWRALSEWCAVRQYEGQRATTAQQWLSLATNPAAVLAVLCEELGATPEMVAEFVRRRRGASLLFVGRFFAVAEFARTADACAIRPLHEGELVLRAEEAMAGDRKDSARTVRVGDMALHLRDGTMEFGGKRTRVSRKDFEELLLLAEEAKRTWLEPGSEPPSRPSSPAPGSRRNHISGLRRAFRKVGNPDAIVARGDGSYALNLDTLLRR